LTATVTSGSGTPTGSVTFTDGASTLGTSSLSGGQATLATSALGAGAHAITATYGGAPGFIGSASSALAQTVNHASTMLVVTSSINPSAYNQPVAFTATITPQFGGQATGTVVFVWTPSGVSCSIAVLNNVATCSVAAPALKTGTNSVTATYYGDTNFTGSTSAPVSQVVNQATTTTGVVSSLNPAYVTQSITFTATVTGQYGGMSTGSVTFKAGTTSLGAATLNSSGQASLTTSFSTAGTRSITAVYAGDLNNHGSTSAALSQAVDKFPTTTTLGSSLDPSLIGQSVTFTATVSSTYGSIPNGDKVTFKNGTTVLATVSLSGGTASYTTSSLAAGSHTITASYSGDSSFQTSSGTFKQTVNKNPSSAAVVSSLNPSTYGQAVTFTASVTGSVGTPTGTVTFKSGSAVLGTVSLSSGTASLTTSTLSAGTKSITVVYNGDLTYADSTSTALSQKVNKAPTGTSISSSSNPSTSGQSVTFTVTVSSATATPSGTVTFKLGATLLGTGTLNGSGVATFTTSTLPVGSDSITANYGGNSNFVASSASMTQVVNP
jgi:Bacterial Ig-like domain (group 3)